MFFTGMNRWSVVSLERLLLTEAFKLEAGAATVRGFSMKLIAIPSRPFRFSDCWITFSVTVLERWVKVMLQEQRRLLYRKRCSLEKMLCLRREVRETDGGRRRYWDYERWSYEHPPTKWCSGWVLKGIFVPLWHCQLWFWNAARGMK